MKVTSHSPLTLQWTPHPIPRSVFTALKRYVAKSTNYGESQVDALTSCITSTDVTYLQAESMRRILVKQKIISRYKFLDKFVKSTSKDYAKGKDILTLSRRVDFPPLALLRGILSLTYDKTAIANAFGRNGNTLSKRDSRQLALAAANDAENIINQDLIARIAMDNETMFVSHFRKLVPSLKTQAELAAEQSEQHGRAVNTPDILFPPGAVVINDTPIRWLEFKDYVGTDVPFLFKSNVEQTARYMAEWGSGAVCYRKGYVDGLELPGVMILDGSILDLPFANI